MKISLDWLSDYVDIDCPAQAVADVLSEVGFPTESIEQVDGDTVIDVEVSSNRGDCLSHIGLARELAAATGKKLRLPPLSPLPPPLPGKAEGKGQSGGDRDVSKFIDVRIDAPELCGRYTARVITGVKVGPTPEWMKRRLETVGIRSVNNIVDATNYAMMETGQPPHAFDYDKLKGGRIIVRKGQKGQSLVSIDQTRCPCDGRMLVIADAEGPVAIAGVMGGLDSEVSDSTTTILLEDAHFNPVSVRTTGRGLTISSEAAFRFERHIDIEGIDYASQRCAELIVQAAGGRVARGVVDVYPARWEPVTVGMRPSRMNLLLGIDVPAAKAMKIFTAMGLNPLEKSEDLIVCTIPSWRHDLYREVDLIEEVARCYGYDGIPVDKKINIEVTPVDERERLANKLRTLLNGCGYYETINVTFVDDSLAAAFADAGQVQAGFLRVNDVSRKSANILRPSLLGSLCGVIRSNYNVGNRPCMVYELADTFRPTDGADGAGVALPDERTMLALAADTDFRSMRGIVEGLAGIVNPQSRLRIDPAGIEWASAGARIAIAGVDIGVIGLISKATASRLDMPDTEICLAELDFQVLMRLHGAIGSVKAIPRFPSITRDVSLIVDEAVTWAQIVECVNKKAPDELEEVQFTGIYRGKPIADGQKSVTVSLLFRNEHGTLKHESVDGFEKAILDELTSTLKAQLRTV